MIYCPALIDRSNVIKAPARHFQHCISVMPDFSNSPACFALFLVTSERFGLVDQHDGNIVLDIVTQLAAPAQQLLFFGLVFGFGGATIDG